MTASRLFFRSDVQVKCKCECRAELARAMLSRSLHSQCISQMHCKGTKNINAKQYFPPIIFKKFQMLKFALEIAWRDAGNHVEKFRKSRRKVQEITWKSRGNRQEKFRKSRGKSSTLSGTQLRSYAVTQLLLPSAQFHFLMDIYVILYIYYNIYII